MKALHTLWAATVRKVPLQERVQAAAAAGYDAISCSPADCFALEGDLAQAGEARRRAEGQGVRLAILEPVVEWYPFTPPARHYTPPPYSVDALLDLAAALGATDVNAVPMAKGDLDVDGYAEHFAVLCDKAAERGLIAQLEFTPFPPAAGLTGGWEIVRRADRPNGGLLFDTWHFYRAGPDFDLLDSLPRGSVLSVQLSDGGPIVESVIKDTFLHRLLPGEGDFDLSRIMRALGAIGGCDRMVGPEVLSLEQHALEPAQAAARAAQACAPYYPQD